jgi:hypothetical protein
VDCGKRIYGKKNARELVEKIFEESWWKEKFTQ